MAKHVSFHYVDNKPVPIYLPALLACKMACYRYNGMNMFSHFVTKLEATVQKSLISTKL